MPAKNEIEILVTAEVDKALRNIKKTEEQTKKTGKGIGKTLGKLKAGWIAVGAVIGGTVVASMKKLISVASEAQETFSKFDAVFKDVSKEAQSTAKTFAKSFGLSELAAKKLLSSTGDLLTGFGFTGKAALEMSKNVNELAVDLGSFQNVSSERASEALTKALLGETESLKSMGVVVRQNTKEFRSNVIEIMRTTGATEQQARSQAIWNQILEQTKNAQGDFAKTSKSFANQMKILGSNITDTAVSIGSKLLPAATKIVTTLNNLFNPIRNVVGQIKVLNDRFSIGFRLAALFSRGIKIVGNIMLLSLLKPLKTTIDTFKLLGKTVFDVFTFAKNVISGGGLRASWKTFRDETKKNAIEFKNSFTDPFKSIAANGKALIDELINGEKKLKQVNAESSAERTEGAKTTTDALISESNRLTGTVIQNADKMREAQLQAYSDILASASQLTGNIVDIEQNKLDSIDEADTKARSKQKERLLKAAKAQKAVAVAEATVQTILAAQKAYTANAGIPPSPVFGVLAAALATAAGVANVTKIASTPLPAFESGGISDGGLAMVGERGRELVNLPAGSRVINHTNTNSVLNQNKNTSLAGANITVVSNDPDDMITQIENKMNAMGSSLF